MASKTIESLACDYGAHDFPMLTVPKIKEQNRSINPEQLFGIEVEAENYKSVDSSILKAWRVDTDNSLRNNGIEFISFPLKAENVKSALELLFKGQTRALDFSKRTSIHVHANVRNLEYQHVQNLVLIYTCFEDALFRFAGEHRKKSIFCVPIKDCSLLYPEYHSGSMCEIRDNWEKYSALNLVPIFKQGTVEFRQMEGNQDVDRICTWVELINHMLVFAKGNNYKELFDRVCNLTTTSEYYLFTTEVFKDYFPFLFPNGKFNLRELDDTVKYIKARLYSSPLNGIEWSYHSPMYKGVESKSKQGIDWKAVLTNTTPIHTTTFFNDTMPPVAPASHDDDIDGQF